MRIRSIKPEFWRSDDVSRLSYEHRLLFIGLWSYVDDNGVGRDVEAFIAADLFAADLSENPLETLAMISRGLQALSEGGQIIRYEVGGKPYLFVTAWTHQKIDRPNTPRLPLPNGEVRRPTEGDRGSFVEYSMKARDIPSPGSEEQGIRGTGDLTTSSPLRGDGPPPPPLTLVQEEPPAPDPFDEFWKAYPRKQAKADAVKAWKAATKKARPDDITDAVREHVGSTWANTERKFIPLAATWLRAERWNDPVEEPAQAPRQRWQEAQDSQLQRWQEQYGFSIPGGGALPPTGSKEITR